MAGRSIRSRSKRWSSHLLLCILTLGALLASLTLPSFARAAPGQLTEFPIPTPGSYPAGIAAGPDGNLWFTERKAHKIGRITPSGQITEFPLTGPTSRSAITAGPDGNVWFAVQGGIGRITPTGKIIDLDLPNREAEVNSLTTGPEGDLWFTAVTPRAELASEARGSSVNLDAPEVNGIGRITPAGEITEFPIAKTEGSPLAITAGSEGDLWFTESRHAQIRNFSFDTGEIGRITPSGEISQFPLPAYEGRVGGITVGADGNLWFTETDSDRIARITPTGQIAAFSLRNHPPLALGVRPWGSLGGISAGPEGNIWFVEPEENKIGRLSPSAIGVQIPPFTVRHGMANVQLICSGGAPNKLCRGALRLTGSRPPHFTRSVTLAVLRYSLPSESSRSLRLRVVLPKGLRNWFLRGGAVFLTATASVKHGQGTFQEFELRHSRSSR